MQTTRDLSGGSASPAGTAEPKQTIYVWELPVRITHWVNVAAILVLSVTGYYIANPFVTTHGPATEHFLMGAIRFVHIGTAMVFTVSVLFRLYWAFAGNRYARWSQFFPVRRGRLRALFRMIGYYTFLRKEPPAEVGHNPLAGITYTGLYVLFAIQIATGFALYSLPLHGGFWPTAFGWIVTLFGAQPVRLVHFIVMWLIIAFTIHHVYSAMLIDIEERSGLLSSIVTGAKSLTPSHLAAAEGEDTPVSRRARAQGRSPEKASAPDA